MPDRNLNILFYSATSVWAGAEAQLFRLMRELRRQGSRLSLAAPDDGPLYHEAKKEGFSVYAAPKRVIPYREPLAFRSKVKWFERIIADVRPDLIHANSFWGARVVSWAIHGPLWNLKRGRRKVEIPLIAHLRDYSPDYATEIRLSARVFPVTHFIAVSDRLKSAYETLGMGPIRRIYDGMDLERFDPEKIDRAAARREFNLQENHFAVGLIGRMNPSKGHRLLLDAGHLLEQEGVPVRCCLAGSPLTDHEETYYIGLKNWIASNGYESFTARLGFVRSLERLYRALDVVVMPTLPTGGERDAEALSQVVMESMAAATCLAVTDVGGAGEVVEHAKTGFVFRAGNVHSLANLLEELYHHADRREQVGRQARRRIVEAFSIEHCAEEVRRLYRDITGRSRRVEAVAVGQ